MKLDILNTNFEALRSVAEESDLMKYVVRLNIDGCKFTVNSGSFEIDNIKINNKNSTINYLLIPRDLVSRIQDILHG